jgi:hypothetical protein
MYRFSDKKAKRRWSRGGWGPRAGGCGVCFFLSFFFVCFFMFLSFYYFFLFLFYFFPFCFLFIFFIERFFCFSFYLYFLSNIIFSISFSFFLLIIFLLFFLFHFSFYLLSTLFVSICIFYILSFLIFFPLIFLLFEMRCKVFLVIIISWSGYKYLVWAIITNCSDFILTLHLFLFMTHKIVSTIIGFYSNSCSRLFWH